MLQFCVGFVLATRASSQQPEGDREFTPVILDVMINGEDYGVVTFLRRGNQFYAKVSDIARWRLRRPPATPIMRAREAFLPLAAFQGLVVLIDEQQQRIRLTAAPDLFEATTIEIRRPSAVPRGTAFGAFLNYDLLAEQIGSAKDASGAFEMGSSDSWGLVSNTLEASHALGATNVTRLDTFYQRDDQVGFRQLTVGDAITRGSDWAQPVRFGGIKFGTDFGLQPNFISFPTPNFAGRATLPSNIELYVNDALRFRGPVNQGPFTLNQVPVVTGAGDLTFVVKDALGVERTVTTRYYASSRLLRAGLTDYSVEVGSVRENYGLRSFDYGEPFAAVTHRYGVTDSVTTEAHAEVARREQVVGLGPSWVWPSVGEFSFALAGGTGDRGTGALGRIAFERDEHWWNLALSYQQSTSKFFQLGVDGPAEQITRQAQAAVGLSFGGYGSVSLSYTDLRLGDGTRVDVTSANYSAPLGSLAYANLFALVSNANDSGRSATIGVGITIPLGKRRSSYMETDSRDGHLSSLAEYRQDPPTNTGFGYRVMASGGLVDQQEADLSWQGDVGTFTGAIERNDGQAAARVLARGGIGFVKGRTFFTRRIDDGFGLVEVPGYSNVHILQENRPLTETDAGGVAVIPSLRSYEENHIAINADDLPIDAKVDADTLTLTPRHHGAVVARFPVARAKGATATLVLSDGKPLPPGIAIAIDGQPNAAYSGYEGEIFIGNIRSGMRLEAQWASGHCIATIGTLPPEAVLPHIGPIVCRPAEAKR